MPSQPKFRQTFEQQQAAQAHSPRNIQKDKAQIDNASDNNRDGQENQQNIGQWGEDRANISQNLSDTNNAPVNQHGRGGDGRGVEEVPMENDTPVNFPEKGGNQQLS